MNQSLIAVIDGTRARLFTLEPAEIPEYQSGPNLLERECLTNMAKELQGKELWANTKSGRNRGSARQGHGYDDHRQKHLDEFERSFAKEIIAKIVGLIQTHRCQTLLLVAEPQILGCLRNGLTPLVPKTLTIQSLAKDLCKLKSQELHEYLALKDLIPPRKVISDAS